MVVFFVVVRILASQDLPSLPECVVRIHKSGWNMLEMKKAKSHINIYQWCIKTWKARSGIFAFHVLIQRIKAKMQTKVVYLAFCFVFLFIHFVWVQCYANHSVKAGACKHRDVKNQERVEATPLLFLNKLSGGCGWACCCHVLHHQRRHTNHHLAGFCFE